MGTNYYHETHICERCERFDSVHIGKSSGGWTFGFHGTEDVRSWAQWKERLTADGRIRDEYGCLVPVEDFIGLVESKRGATLNHTTYCRKHHPEYAERDCWLDDEGNSFSSGEFS